MEELLVIKIGGNVIDDAEALDSFLQNLGSIRTPKILVHGGGKMATELSAKLGITTNLVEGRRITDAETIKVVTMTYAGWINKTIVAKLQAKDITAIGLSGADANLLPAVKRPVKDIDYGWVGDLDSSLINTGLINHLLTGGLMLVVAPISCDDDGNLLNINADTVARTLAEGMSEDFNTTLIYCFEKNGLLADVDNEQSVIAELNETKAALLKSTGAVSKGMVPKIDNALGAVKNGVSCVVIGHAAHIKQLAQKQKGYGTRITK